MSAVGLAKAHKGSNMLCYLWDLPLLDGLYLFGVQPNAIIAHDEPEIRNLLQSKLALLGIGVELVGLQSLKDLFHIQQMLLVCRGED